MAKPMSLFDYVLLFPGLTLILTMIASAFINKFIPEWNEFVLIVFYVNLAVAFLTVPIIAFRIRKM